VTTSIHRTEVTDSLEKDEKSQINELKEAARLNDPKLVWKLIKRISNTEKNEMVIV
jgi:hypothetical protein